MLRSTRRLLAEDLHPSERSALIDIVAMRGGPADAGALSPRLLGEAEPQWDLLEPVVRHGGAVVIERLYDRFVADDRLIDGADPQLLRAFGWAGLESARSMLFHYACEMNWDAAPAAVDGLVHLSPAGMEDQVRAAVGTCVGRSLFPEYLPALAGWIGDAELIDRFLTNDHTSPSTNCMGGVLLGVGLLGPAGRQRLYDLFWTDQYPMIWSDTPRETGMAMRMTGLGVADLAAELRARVAAMEGVPPHWWFVLVRNMARHQVGNQGSPPVWRFLPPPEAPLDLHRALWGPDDTLEQDLGYLAHQRLGPDGEWLSGEIADLRAPLDRLVREDALLAELAPA